MTKKISILLVLIAGLVFLPTSVLIVFGMMPTIAAYTIDRTTGRNKTICVGFMNFAGCFPFLLDFWTKFGEQTLENALSIIADVQTVITIYLLAAGGYAIHVAVTGITSSLIMQRSSSRVAAIKQEQKTLIDLWGQKVTGKYKLDQYGFPVDVVEQRTKL